MDSQSSSKMVTARAELSNTMGITSEAGCRTTVKLSESSKTSSLVIGKRKHSFPFIVCSLKTTVCEIDSKSSFPATKTLIQPPHNGVNGLPCAVPDSVTAVIVRSVSKIVVERLTQTSRGPPLSSMEISLPMKAVTSAK